MSTFLHYVHCKDALLDCSAPGGERCESLTWVDEIGSFNIEMDILSVVFVQNIESIYLICYFVVGHKPETQSKNIPRSHQHWHYQTA